MVVCSLVESVQENVRTLIHDLTKSDMMDALVYIRAEAETVLATYDPNAEIVRNYAGIGKGTTFTISHPLDLSKRKATIRRALVRCGKPMQNCIVGTGQSFRGLFRRPTKINLENPK